jgi:methyltransferase (TIGR00027 family)
MNRSENDSWDLASSVGATASMVAAARAVATRRTDPLVHDPYAEVLVRAAGVDLFSRLASGSLEFEDVGPGWLPEFFGIRACFFDRFVATALSGSTRQVVIVGSGLDSRAYRLEWPAGTVVYEIDLPKVIEFKATTLAREGARPRTEVRMVGADLRQDWPAALCHAGFDPSRPTVWLVEGLMIGYLPGDAQDRLLGHITALSSVASQLVADHLHADSPSVGSFLLEVAETWKQSGFDVDFGNLTYAHDRNDAEKFLHTHDWVTDAYTITDLIEGAGLTTHSLDTGPDSHGAIHYLIATRC